MPNEFLSQLYGTGDVDQGMDQEGMLEKMASIEVLSGIAAEAGKDLSEVDWDQLSTDDINELIKEASGEYAEQEIDPEFQEKLAEWDFAGRAMAHAFYAESRDLEKTAVSAAEWKELKAAGLSKADMAVYAKSEGRAGGVSPHTINSKVPRPTHPVEINRLREQFNEAEKARDTYKGGRSNAGMLGDAVEGRRSGLRQAGSLIKNYWRSGKGGKAKVIGAGVGALGALGGLGYGAAKAFGRGKEARGSAVDALAQQRALEFLEYHGVGTEKTASVTEQLVQQRAAEMLIEAGYGELLD